MKLEKPKKNPPAVSIKSPQYNLFSQFVTNDPSEVGLNPIKVRIYQ